MTKKPVEGDVVVLYGIASNFKGTAQIKDGRLLQLNKEVYKLPEEKPIEGNAVAVAIADKAAELGWQNSLQYKEFTMNTIISVSVDSTPANPQYGANSGKYYASGNNWRIYQNENPAITIAAAEGHKIAKVIIEYTSEKTGVLTNADKTVQYTTGAEIEVNAQTVTFSVGNTGTATNGQVRITKITVVYE